MEAQHDFPSASRQVEGARWQLLLEDEEDGAEQNPQGTCDGWTCSSSEN